MYENIRNIAFAIALTILLPLTMWYGLDLLTKDPYTFFYGALIFGLTCTIIGTFIQTGYIGAGFILGGVIGTVYGFLNVRDQLTELMGFINLLAILGFVLGLIFINLRLKKD